MKTLNWLRVFCSTGSLLFSLCTATVLIASCSANHGRLVYNDNVKKAFESYQVPPNHNYYYSGPDALPNALIGIQNEYSLESKFWIPFEPSQDLMKKWLEWRKPRHRYNMDKSGSTIHAPDDTQIGIWYAVRNWRDWTTVKQIDDKTFVVSPPIEARSRGKRYNDSD